MGRRAPLKFIHHFCGEIEYGGAQTSCDGVTPRNHLSHFVSLHLISMYLNPFSWTMVEWFCPIWWRILTNTMFEVLYHVVSRIWNCSHLLWSIVESCMSCFCCLLWVSHWIVSGYVEVLGSRMCFPLKPTHEIGRKKELPYYWWVRTVGAYEIGIWSWMTIPLSR